LSVLVVDDDAPFRELATRILTGWGHTVVGQAGTVEQALGLAAALTPDLALVDYGLPDGDGLSLTRRLRAMAKPPRVVMISSDSDRATVVVAREAGAEAFFLKDEIYGSAFRLCVAEEPQP
jgi:DNA-binding response OmpR family regulator